MKVRRIPMGVEGIWGGTSWISLRSVHFLEVYIKPKKKKRTLSQSPQRLANTVQWWGHAPKVKNCFVKNSQWRINIHSDAVVLINGKFPQTKLYRPQSGDEHEMGLAPIWWHGQDFRFQASRSKHWSTSPGKVCVRYVMFYSLCAEKLLCDFQEVPS